MIHDHVRLRMWVMITVRVLSLALVALMVAVIVVGFVSGDFSKEGSEILGLTWGRVTLIDLYVGLAIFGIWVAFRERSWSRTLVWTLALVILGNLAAAVYVARAAFSSPDATTLLLGHQPS